MLNCNMIFNYKIKHGILVFLLNLKRKIMLERKLTMLNMFFLFNKVNLMSNTVI